MALTKETADQWMNVDGYCRGLGLKNDYDYIEKRAGASSVAKVEEEMASVGYPLKHKEIKALHFYPFGYAPVIELAIESSLGYGPEDFYEMGQFATKISIFTRTMFRYFLSVRLAVTLGTSVWREYFSMGTFRATEVNENEKRIRLRVSDFRASEPGWNIIRGYCAQTTQMIVNKPTECRESVRSESPLFREFLVTWK